MILFLDIGFALALFATVFDLLNIDWKWTETILGLSMILIAAGLEKTFYRDFNAYWYFFGGLGFLIGAFALLQDTKIELLYIFICAIVIYAGTFYKSKMLLITSIAALLVYIGYFSYKHFEESLGWPVILIIIGIVFFVVGILAQIKQQ